ncbi:MAG: ATP-dependent helicase HrpA [Burkholderiaceae bacterium]|jgi:ATP-dependent helicase HrpA|nr:MAG: ATP-dependent helicase HrpA [Burkholderiaceae bacterium]
MPASFTDRPALTAALKIDFPDSLPVSMRRDEIMDAIRATQVVVVCGETGSGKTTQLPKIALAMGRGRCNAAPGQKGRLIGHTQPRRIAASSVAKRIAQELNTPLGEVVGYKVRFQDRLSPGASVKLMTDGILLAETQSDSLLEAYDTLIIDEAHERSLNIDFLLGYLRQILPKRPDLKVIVTSATIDAERFARHFADGKEQPAPVIQVSGRMFPVEQRWRPFEESRDYGLNEAIADAVDELWRDAHQGGDILVFLPGEREIREAADHLRRHLAHSPVLRSAEVLPLFARLSQPEQDRIFDPHGARRIVLATNVAETSLTVPGIKYVIDAGTARVKRYSFKSKVEQLLVEPIAQAAANQRAGRCGRVADGICIRLYGEDDFAGRPRFTDPEILRSSLASVILRMKSLHLADIARFPFLEAPSSRAIADGMQLLGELGAVDDAGELTAIGKELAKLPLDPRVGRMIVEARERGALAEVLVIAAALSVQDVRDRPLDAQAQADQAHAKFDDDKSEFSGYLRLWQWLHDARGGGPIAQTRREMQAAAQGPKKANAAVLPVVQRMAQAPSPQPSPASGRGGQTLPLPLAGEGGGEGNHPHHKLSNRQYEQLLRQNFISVRRVREWRDIHSQLLTVVTEHKWKLNTAPAGYEALHKSMLAGLLGNVGCKMDEEAGSASGEYLGARGIKFHRHPGAHLRKKPGRWIVCAELVETTRLFGRGIASIEPTWIEEVAGHLLNKQLLDPHWEKKEARVAAFERATLYGLVVYSGRRVDYARVDPAGAREIFLREALVAGQWDTKLPFLAANRKLLREVESLEHKSRRQDVLVDEALIYAFYDAQVPADVASGQAFERWWREAAKANPRLLLLAKEELMRHQAAGITTQAFPPTVKLGGVDCAASYLHEPSDAKDGLTVTVPLFVLNQVSEERCEWLVPGMLKDKIQALLKSLPQKPRARFVPLPQAAARLAEVLSAPEAYGHGSLTDALQRRVRDETGLDVKRTDFKLDMVPAHLFINLRVVGDDGRQLGMGRNLAALKAELGGQARGAFQALAGLKRVGERKISEQNAAQAQAGGSQVAIKSEATRVAAAAPAAMPDSQRYTDWTFGELPELMEIKKGGQALIGFPALIDRGDAVTIELFDEPEAAAVRHRAGLRRLFALQMKDALKHLEKNIPDLQRMAVAYMQVGRAPDGSGGGTLEELRAQIVEVALDRAFLQPPLPVDQPAFERRVDEGRGRLVLIANEVARLAGAILAEHAAAARKLKDTKNAPEATQDAQRQLQRLMPKNFIAAVPWAQLAHLPRYLKAITLRLDKVRADPARDAARLAELRPLEQRCWRLVAERRGVLDARLAEFRWLLEELRVSLFAQELRTPQPVSVKRLEKAWGQLQG